MNKSVPGLSTVWEAVGTTVMIAIFFAVGVWILATIVGAVGFGIILVAPVVAPVEGPTYTDLAYQWIFYGPARPYVFGLMFATGGAIGYAAVVGGTMILLQTLYEKTLRLQKMVANYV